MTIQLPAMKKQRCYVAGLILSWVGYAVGAAWLGYDHRWTGLGLWSVLVPGIRWGLFRHFSAISRFLGYGRVEDVAPSSLPKAPVAVTFYSFFSCPFCPIVLQRLEALQKEMGFTLERIDLTRQPQLLLSKGISAVPVVETGGRRLTGNATTQQLAEMIAPGRPAASLGVA